MGPAIGNRRSIPSPTRSSTGSCRHDRADGQDPGPGSKLPAVRGDRPVPGNRPRSTSSPPPPTSAASSPTSRSSGVTSSTRGPTDPGPPWKNGAREGSTAPPRPPLHPAGERRAEGSATFVPEPSGADPLKAVNVHLDTLSARAASLVADLKRHQDEQSLFSRYDSVLKVLAPLIGMVRESRELEVHGADPFLEGGRAVGDPPGGRALPPDGRPVRDPLSRGGQGYAGRAAHLPGGKGRGSASLLWRRTSASLRLPASVRKNRSRRLSRIIAAQAGRASAAIREIEASLAGMSREWRGHAPRASPVAREPDRSGSAASGSFLRDPCDVSCFHGWVPERRVGGGLRKGNRGGVRGPRESSSGSPSRRRRRRRSRRPAQPPAVRPFEIFTRVLPLPRYGTIDPTPLVAFFFPLFYGVIIGGHRVRPPSPGDRPARTMAIRKETPS